MCNQAISQCSDSITVKSASHLPAYTSRPHTELMIKFNISLVHMPREVAICTNLALNRNVWAGIAVV